MTGYAELQVTTNYSFLRGASHVEELFLRARELGLPALGITDRNSLAGIVRAHQRAEEIGVRLVVGCRLDLADGTAVLAYPMDRPAYSRLCRLLTLGKGRAGKGGCDLSWDDLAAHGEGLLVILLENQPDDGLDAKLARLRAGFPDRAYLALTMHYRPGDHVRLHRLAEMAGRHGVPTVVTGDVLYHVPERRILQDVVTCIREGCTIDEAGFRLERGGDRHLLSPPEVGAAVPAARAGGRAHAGDRRALPVFALRTALPVPGRGRGAGPDAAAGAGGAWSGSTRRAATRTGCRRTPNASCATSCG